MEIELGNFRKKISRLKLDDAIIALNQLLAQDRKIALESSRELIDPSDRVLPHVVHFLTKELIRECSNFGTLFLNDHSFFALQHEIINLPDPIQFDPNWEQSDPTGTIERMLQNQIPSQEFRPLQKIGLALALYRDVGIINHPISFDIRKEVEAEIGVTIDTYILLGFLLSAVSGVPGSSGTCPGSFSPRLLSRAYEQGISFCVPEYWQPFLQRTACSIEEFRRRLAELPTNNRYIQFIFNPLKRNPIVDVGKQRFIAPDPYILLERVTHGIYFDLFDKDRMRFSERFGHAFDLLVFQLLTSCVDPKLLWLESRIRSSQEPNWSPPSRNSDQAYKGSDTTVLIECKSMRPSLALTTYGTEASMADVVSRLYDAVKQLICHTVSIQEGKWSEYGLPPADCIGIVVTYGRIYTANTSLVRKNINDRLAAVGLPTFPWFVLSLDELDMLVSLVDRGHKFDQVVIRLVADLNDYDGLFKTYIPLLKENAISTFARAKAKALLDSITETPDI